MSPRKKEPGASCCLVQSVGPSRIPGFLLPQEPKREQRQTAVWGGAREETRGGKSAALNPNPSLSGLPGAQALAQDRDQIM